MLRGVKLNQYIFSTVYGIVEVSKIRNKNYKYPHSIHVVNHEDCIVTINIISKKKIVEIEHDYNGLNINSVNTLPTLFKNKIHALRYLASLK